MMNIRMTGNWIIENWDEFLREGEAKIGTSLIE